MTIEKCFIVAALVISAPIVTHAATYSAADNTLPAAPFTRYDADHFASAFPLSPYFGTGFNAAHSVAGSVYDSGATDTGKYTFWYTDAVPLNPAVGFEIAAMLRVTASTSSSVDRAGIAIAFTDSSNQYSELYLSTNGIFLNGVGRTHDASAAYAIDTTDTFREYVLRVNGTNVSVLVDGSPVLSGFTFDANSVNAPTLPNWAVLGDITGSAAGQFESTGWFVAAVPEPSVLGLATIAGISLLRHKPRV